MNGIHEVTGSIPVWSTNLCSHSRPRFNPAILIVLLGALSAACASPTSPPVQYAPVQITGVVMFYGLEGGFWAIKSDDGQIYEPKNLPSALQKENLHVDMLARIRSDLVSVHMVGPIIEIVQMVALNISGQ
jgi:hypothetical protein